MESSKYSGIASLAFLLCMPAITAMGQESSPPQIYWLRSAPMAVRMAQESKLPILVYVTSGDCLYCRKMEREVWSNHHIIEMVEGGFVPLKLDAERDAELVATLKVRSLPTTLMFTSNAEFINGAAGYLSPSRVAELLRSGQESLAAPKEIVPQQ